MKHPALSLLAICRTGSFPAVVVASLVALFALSSEAEARSHKKAPSFRLSTFGGKSFSLGSYRRQPVVVHFWASWCKPCMKELPLLDQLHQGLKSGAVLALSIDDKKQKSHAIEKHLGLTLPVLYQAGSVAQHYEVPAMPSSFVIDCEGRIRRVISGAMGKDEISGLAKELGRLVQEKSCK